MQFSRKQKWLVGIAVAGLVTVCGMIVAGVVLSRRLEPFLKQEAIRYLSERFDGEVELESLRLTSKVASPWRAFWDQGKDAFVEVTAKGIRLRQVGRGGVPPLLTIHELRFEVELESVARRPLRLRHVRLTGFALVIPPKHERGKMAGGQGVTGGLAKATPSFADEIIADGAKLVILPKRVDREPLRFEMEKLRLHPGERGEPIDYEAILTNPKPPGRIETKGKVGPFQGSEPGETPVEGTYVFHNADLGVFRGIAGMLESTGRFAGPLNRLLVDGETRTLDFRLSGVGNRVPLLTRFHAIVDGTNGDTFLEPVEARLGGSDLTVRGSVARIEGESGKTVALSAVVRKGKVEDFLKLAMKGEVPLRGGIGMNIRLVVPPGKGDYAARLVVGGEFSLDSALFNSPTIQAKMDDLSRRAQGKPNATVNAIASDFAGKFDLRGGVLKLERILFNIPGAELMMAGRIDLNQDTVEAEGPVRTLARVSQMVKSRWKRILLKPVDPFFAKDGAGSVFYLRVSGSRNNPDFSVKRSAGR